MNKELKEKLAAIAPSVAFNVIWTHDEDARWSDLAEVMQDENPDDWQAWQSEVTAEAIVDGTELTASTYLGGTWEKYGDNPWESNPDISGYLPQMLEKSVDELLKQLIQTDSKVGKELLAAEAFLKDYMRKRYDEQIANRASTVA